MRITLERGHRKHSLIGESLGAGRIRIVNIDGYPVEVNGSHHTIVLVAEDVKGSIARIAGLQNGSLDAAMFFGDGMDIAAAAIGGTIVGDLRDPATKASPQIAALRGSSLLWASQTAFVKANPGLSRANLAVACDSKRLSEVRLCLSKGFSFRDCAEVTLHSCRLAKIWMPAMRGG